MMMMRRGRMVSMMMMMIFLMMMMFMIIHYDIHSRYTMTMTILLYLTQSNKEFILWITLSSIFVKQNLRKTGGVLNPWDEQVGGVSIFHISDFHQ